MSSKLFTKSVGLLFLASISLLISCTSDRSSQRSDVPPLFKTYFQIPKDRFTSTLSNWDKVKINEEKKQSIASLKEAMQAFQDGKFETMNQLATTIFENDLTLDLNSERELRFYQAIALMQMGNFPEADAVFNQLTNLPVFKYNLELNWYRALNYLAMDKKQASRKILQSLIEKQVQPYVVPAEQILQELN